MATLARLSRVRTASSHNRLATCRPYELEPVDMTFTLAHLAVPSTYWRSTLVYTKE